MLLQTVIFCARQPNHLAQSLGKRRSAERELFPIFLGEATSNAGAIGTQ